MYESLMSEKTKEDIVANESDLIPEMIDFLEYCQPTDVLYTFYGTDAATMLNPFTHTLLIYDYDEVKVGLWEDDEELAFVDNGEEEMQVFDAFGNEVDYFE